jgi:DNA recombination-dependent growth factor C
MICKQCAVGAELNRRSDIIHAKLSHDICKGCDCQHKTGTGWTKPVRIPNKKA